MAPLPRRRPGSTKPWSALSKDYRARLARRGITREDWLRGVDLRGARGHAPKPPANAAPAEATARFIAGEGTEADVRALGTYARSANRPSWIPKDLPFDAIAALSQLRGRPNDWAQVRFIPRPDGEPWTMVVTPKGSPRRADGRSAYDQVILIPGGGGPGTGARAVLDLFFHPESSGVKSNTPGWGKGWFETGGGALIGEATVGYGDDDDYYEAIADASLEDF